MPAAHRHGAEAMARVLIVGGAARGRRLARALAGDGLQVRMATSDPAQAAAIAEAGAEPVVADPDRIGTLMDALAGVTVVCWLMGDPEGAVSEPAAAALHGDRLQMLLERIVDTPVRGLLYEAAGGLPAEHYVRGRAIVGRAADTWALPVAVSDADPADADAWLAGALAAVGRLLTPGTPGR